jgi:hypothetical protein
MFYMGLVSCVGNVLICVRPTMVDALTDETDDGGRVGTPVVHGAGAQKKKGRDTNSMGSHGGSLNQAGWGWQGRFWNWHWYLFALISTFWVVQ